MNDNEPWRRLVTADGTLAVALHRLGADPDTHDPDASDDGADDDARHRLLISHATGFHAHCYVPLARALPPGWTSIGIDHRGHGYSAPDPNADRVPADEAGSGPTVVPWGPFGDDTVSAARWFGGGRDHSVIGFGHSMGGASLILAAAAHPELFELLVLFEPIAPSGFYADDNNPEGSRLAVGARRRRRTFDSVAAAIENFSAKPPMSAMTDEVLEQYVVHGFAPSPDGITLRCTPEFESATFNGAMTNGVWEALARVSTPTIIVSGAPAPDEPSSWAPGIAEQLPNAELVVFEDQTHFGPFSHPTVIADLIADRITAPS